jgi:hypothetical protein
MQDRNHEQLSQPQDRQRAPALDEALELSESVKRRLRSPVAVLVNASGR